MIRLEVQYRQSSDTGTDGPWEDGGTFALDELVVIDGLEVGVSYDVRSRTVRPDGRASAWRTHLGVVVARAAEEPALPVPVGLHATDEGCLTWQLPDPAFPVAGFELRHAPPEEGAWERGEPLHDGVVAAPPFSLCRLPGGQRAVWVAVRGKDGTTGTAARTVVEIRPTADVYEHVITTQDEGALNWSGLRQGGFPNAGALVATLLSGTADEAPFWPEDLEPMWSVDEDARMVLGPYWWDYVLGESARWWPEDDTAPWWDVPYRWIEYVWTVQVHSCHVYGPARLTVDVEVSSPNGPWRLMYRRPGSASPMWPPSDYAAWPPHADGSMWGPVDEPWEPWAGRLDVVEPGAHTFRLLVPGGAKQGSIIRAVTTLSAPTRRELHPAVSVPINGGGRVKPTQQFRGLVHVNVTERVGTPFGVRVDVDDLDRTNGPQLVARDEDGVLEAAVVDVELVGY